MGDVALFVCPCRGSDQDFISVLEEVHAWIGSDYFRQTLDTDSRPLDPLSRWNDLPADAEALDVGASVNRLRALEIADSNKLRTGRSCGHLARWQDSLHFVALHSARVKEIREADAVGRGEEGAGEP